MESPNWFTSRVRTSLWRQKLLNFSRPLKYPARTRLTSHRSLLIGVIVSTQTPGKTMIVTTMIATMIAIIDPLKPKKQINWRNLTQRAALHPPRHLIGAPQYPLYQPTYPSVAVVVVRVLSEGERILFVLSLQSRLKDHQSSYPMKNLRWCAVKSLKICVAQMIFFFSSKIPLELRELPLSQQIKKSYCWVPPHLLRLLTFNES